MTETSSDPPARTAAWRQLGRGMLLCFGINTAHGLEWSDGTLDPRAFTPGLPDVDDWCARIADAGFRYVVPIAKHHDGFCMWPTATTAYEIRASGCDPRYLERLAAAARRRGLQVGLYYSLWDRSHPAYADDAAYAALMADQIRECCDRVGEIVELWCDGFWDKCGCYTDEAGERRNLVPRGDYAALARRWEAEGRVRWRWDAWVGAVRALQPGCVILNNSTTDWPAAALGPVDAVVAEKGHQGRLAVQPTLPLEICTTLQVEGPPGMFADGAWFWHPGLRCAGAEEVVSWWARARDQGAQLLLSTGPDPAGRLADEDRELLASLPACREW